MCSLREGLGHQTSRIALVTGASRGIGRALSYELVRMGWTVVGVARSREALHHLQASLGDEVFIPCICDVSVSEQVKKVSQQLREKQLTPVLFFLNAGIAGEAACESPDGLNVSKHAEIFATNYFGALTWIEAWLPFIRVPSRANFVVISSMNAIFAPPNGSAYAASKAAIAKAFEALSLTYHNCNVSFSVIYPGPVATAGLKGTFPFTWSPEKMTKFVISKAMKGKARAENSFFYSLLFRVLRILPKKLTMKILGG